MLKNSKYDGALSKNEEANEHNQKYIFEPSVPLLISIIYLCISSEFVFSINNTGAITINITRNVRATSPNGAKSIFADFVRLAYNEIPQNNNKIISFMYIFISIANTITVTNINVTFVQPVISNENLRSRK